MTVSPSLSFAAHLPFKYVGGDPSVDLVNTVDWTARGLVEDRLTDYDRLTRWAEGAGLITARQGTQVRTLGVRHPRVAERVHREAVELRWQLRNLFIAVGRRERVDDGAALEAFNESLRAALSESTLTEPPRGAAAEAPLQWSWRQSSERLDAVVWPVLRAAADLLTSPEATRIRECAGADCGWIYVDRSRNG